MSIWKVSPTETAEGSEPFEPNSAAWEQLLSTLNLQTTSDSSDDIRDETRNSHAAVFSKGKQSHLDDKFKKHPSSAGRMECAKLTKSLNATRDDDDAGYSSEDEHDSPANVTLPESVLPRFNPSRSLTATAKLGRTKSGGADPSSSNDVPKSYFFVNGVRHCVQEEQNGVKWDGAPPPQTKPTTPRTVVTSNNAGAPGAWGYISKPAAHIPMPFQNPPNYEAVRTVPGSGGTPPSLNCKVMAVPSAIPSNIAYCPADGKVLEGAPSSGMPASYTPSRVPMPSTSVAPFNTGTAASTSNAAPAANSVVGYVYVDSNGCLRVASGNGSPHPSTPLSVCLPTLPPPLTGPPQLARKLSEATVMLRGASSVPEVPPMQYAATYVTDGSTCQPTMSSVPESRPSADAWGSTKAWVFRDGRWISLSM
ncbi:hypothetical protein ABB37_05944 [Leptomonas pyrrhocoris]|uniref:Uncharacterized protein n=1 Tax=Leptomonas pyrrhocoris TaxID=157538 RepID=A0A0N0VEQ1_LEPPY|nr:hypothetical protein ABB37_05944 [Leptomonas pyrrhocoris]XP_015657318.1 hypothetical protein ABB37_05944 [Leptomonas pyrrhocoris]KPA78878.1 hypothetical protein ABB37_05944 [Leptomonas pyrrhocoris]KPA78879.1 hypothetical protein ABB37_05944 [Leptomonas pyrrhocoris]|eukprot:XP_015657317.1 hypothetical protein ABB37_05944 [Leptomonas pyrrhocoris]